MTKPWRDGVGRQGAATELAPAVFPKQKLCLGAPGDLSALAADMELFTPALAYVFGGLTDVLWFDLSAELGHDLPLFFWESPLPLLAGLELACGDVAWNHALWATPRVYWPLLCDFLLSVVFHDRRLGTACGFGLQQLLLHDPLALVGGLAPAPLRVTAFGINGSDRRLAFVPADAGVGRPTATRLAPAEEMCRVAAALGRGDAGGLADEHGGGCER